MLSHIDDKFHDDLRYYLQFSILWLKFVQKARWFRETEARTIYVERSLCKMNESMVHVFALKSKNFRWLYRDDYHLACFFESFLYYELLVHKTLHWLKLLSKKKPLVTLWARHLVLKHIVASLFTPCLFYVEGIIFWAVTQCNTGIQKQMITLIFKFSL